MWESLRDTIGKIAPTAAGLLGGPAAGLAVKVIADALGVKEDPDEIMQAIKSDPSAAVKLREMDAKLETARINARGDVIKAEATGESWLQRNWRPMTMLGFVGLIGAHWFGFTATNLTEDQILAMFDLVSLGLGGYVIGRSVEKITKTAAGAGVFETVFNKIRK